MCIIKKLKERKRKRRERIYEGPYEDGGTRRRIDTDAPKDISSNELEYFFCRFSTLSIMEDDSNLHCAEYAFGATKKEDGVHCTVSCKYGLEIKREEIRPHELLSTLNELIKRYEISKHNGKFYDVAGLPYFYGSEIDAVFKSGEEIHARNNQDPFIEIGFMQELCSAFGISQINEEN